MGVRLERGYWRLDRLKRRRNNVQQLRTEQRGSCFLLLLTSYSFYSAIPRHSWVSWLYKPQRHYTLYRLLHRRLNAVGRKAKPNPRVSACRLAFYVSPLTLLLSRRESKTIHKWNWLKLVFVQSPFSLTRTRTFRSAHTSSTSVFSAQL